MNDIEKNRAELFKELEGLKEKIEKAKSIGSQQVKPSDRQWSITAVFHKFRARFLKRE